MNGALHDRTARRLVALVAVALLMATVVFYADPTVVGLHLAGKGWTVQLLEKGLLGSPGDDSMGYMRRAEAAFQSPGHLIYAQMFLVRHDKFIYPPSSLFLNEALELAPKIHLTPQGVFKAMLLVCWAGTVLLGVLLYRSESGGISLMESLCCLLLGILFMPLTVALVSGQVQTMVMFLWGAAVWLWSDRRRGCSGAVLALCCVFKPQMALFLLWAAWRREWRFSAAFVATLATVEALSVAHFGWQNHLDYLKVLNYISRHGEAGVQNQSVAGLMNRLLHNGDPLVWQDTVYPPYRASVYVATTAFAVVAVSTALILPYRKRWQGTTADLIFFGCVATIVSPIVWRHHYSILFFAVVYLAARAGEMTGARWLALVMATLAMGNYLGPLDYFSSGLLSLLDGYVFYAGLVVLALLALETRPESVVAGA